MATLVIMYGNLPLSAYVFYIQMIKYWLSTPSHQIVETDYMQYHCCHWQCHTYHSRNHVEWLKEAGWSHLSKVLIWLQMFDQNSTLIVVLSKRTRNCVPNKETSSPTTMLVDFLQMSWIFYPFQYLHFNLVSTSWKHCGKFGLVISVMHQPRLDMCNN
jgi:hypothetical protein